MCTGNELMYAIVIRFEFWLVVVGKVNFIDEIIETVKDQLSKNVRANR